MFKQLHQIFKSCHQVGLVWQGGNGWDEMVREQVKMKTKKKNIFSYEIRDFSIVETTMIKHIHTYTLATTGTTIVNWEKRNKSVYILNLYTHFAWNWRHIQLSIHFSMVWCFTFVRYTTSLYSSQSGKNISIRFVFSLLVLCVRFVCRDMCLKKICWYDVKMLFFSLFLFNWIWTGNSWKSRQ